MATPNYGYEKRQKELAKKRKKEEKLKAKADKSKHGDTGAEEGTEEAGTPDEPGTTSGADSSADRA